MKPPDDELSVQGLDRDDAARFQSSYHLSRVGVTVCVRLCPWQSNPTVSGERVEQLINIRVELPGLLLNPQWLGGIYSGSIVIF